MNLKEVMEDTEKSLDRAWSNYDDRVVQKAKLAFHRIIKPFCMARNWHFYSGMGAWTFSKAGVNPLHSDDHLRAKFERDGVFANIAELLDMTPEGFPSNSIGSMMPEWKETVPRQWEMLTKRTNDPKLLWLEDQLDVAGVAHRRNGESFHAPILEVDKAKLDKAWEILTPVDDVPDDDPRFEEE
jgi:hypothetical protein